MVLFQPRRGAVRLVCGPSSSPSNVVCFGLGGTGKCSSLISTTWDSLNGSLSMNNFSWSSCERRQSQEPPVLPSWWHGSLKYLSICRMSQDLYYSSDSQKGISKAAVSLFVMFYIWSLSCLKTSLTIMTFLAFILKMILKGKPSLRFPNLGS